MAEYDLRRAVASVGDLPQNFVLYRGEDADQILVTQNPATVKQIAGVEAECGKLQRVLGGICFRDGEQLVFSTKFNPAPAWKMLIAGVLESRRCPIPGAIDLRQLGPGEPEEVGVRSATSHLGDGAGDQPPQVKDKWEHLKASILPDLKAALASPTAGESVAKTVAAASAAEKAGDYAGAIAIMEPLATSLFLDALAAEAPDDSGKPPAG